MFVVRMREKTVESLGNIKIRESWPPTNKTASCDRTLRERKSIDYGGNLRTNTAHARPEERFREKRTQDGSTGRGVTTRHLDTQHPHGKIGKKKKRRTDRD